MIRVINRSTQRTGNEPSENIYYFRTEDDIRRFIGFICYGNADKWGSPVYVGARGLSVDSVDEIVQEILRTQYLYNKLTGLRVREQIVEVSKDVLDASDICYQIIRLAFIYSSYYFYQGFQSIYAIFDGVDRYNIVYAINSVSFQDGHKFTHNSYDIDLRDQNAARAALQMVRNNRQDIDIFDFETLEYCPYYYSPL